VLRGPATLLYGSGAIGGVVNVIDNRIPTQLPGRLIGGAFEQRFNSVDDESTTMLKIEGGKDHLAYHFDGFNRVTDNLDIGGQAIDQQAALATNPTLSVPLKNSYGWIPNTYAHAVSGSAGVSVVGDAGFAGVSINNLENNYGVPPDGSGGPNVRIDLHQTRYDFKSELNKPLPFVETLRLRLGYTDYSHTELDGGLPGTAFSNQTYEGRMELVHQPIGPLKGSVGFQSINSSFAAFDFTGAKPSYPPPRSTATACLRWSRSTMGRLATNSVRVWNRVPSPRRACLPSIIPRSVLRLRDCGRSTAATTSASV